MSRGRIFIFGVLLLLAAFVVLSDSWHEAILKAFAYAEAYIVRHPGWGIGLYVLWAAFSAMLAFVSSALVVPVGVQVWGPVPSLLLLWAGWTLGGVLSFGVGRYLGRRVVTAFVAEEKIARLEARITGRVTFARVLLFQLTLPSEIPGYVLGMLRYRFVMYLGALILAELPYAIGTVYLSETFLNRQFTTLLMIGLGGLLLGALVYLYVGRRRKRSAATVPAAPPVPPAPAAQPPPP